MEARAQTIGEFLEEWFPGCDIDAGLKRVQTFVENLTKFGERAVVWGCEMVDRLEKLPPAPGYEPVLIERGHHPLMARGLSHWIIRAGKDEANKAKMQRIVADAIRFLAKPGRKKGSISRKAAMPLEGWNTSSNLGDAFNGVGVSVFEFVEALEGAVRGAPAASQRVTEVAAALAPGLSVRRGPKASAPSVAHEFLLTCVANMAGPKAYP
jgi:hypothetical protein